MRICPFISHMISDDWADALQVDFPRTRKVRSGHQDGVNILSDGSTHKGNDTQTQALPCRLTYVIADSRSEIIMGLGFVDLLPEQRRSVDAVLAASMVPAD